MEHIKAEYRALIVLRVLEREASYQSNDEILSSYLQELGLGDGKAAVRSCLERLDEKGLLNLYNRNGVLVVELTERGAEVARGVLVADGVLRPSPECPYWEP